MLHPASCDCPECQTQGFGLLVLAMLILWAFTLPYTRPQPTGDAPFFPSVEGHDAPAGGRQ